MMDERTLQAIEFPRALALLARRCVSAPGKAAALALRPDGEPAEVRRLQEEAEEALRLLGEGLKLPLVPFEDSDSWLEDIRRRGGALEGERFLDILHLLGAGAEAARFLSERAGRLPRLQARMAGADLLFPLAAQIRRVLNERGEVRDEASPELAQARSALRSLRGQILRLLDRVMAEHLTAIQEALVVQRRERYVVPAKTSFRRSFEGVVQDRSASGETLFVEPLQAVPLNNELAEAREAERAEVERLLRELTAAVMASRRELADLSSRLAGLDLIWAKGLLAVEWKGIRPGESGRIVLRGARHPLLAAGAGAVPPGEVVPIDLEVGGGVRQLVITGPNTGGKTVALKTVGLFAALNQCGVPLPAGEGTELPLVRRLFADIGDEQDLQQNLSTFSGHMARIAGPVAGAGEGDLLLLDELGTGTDPAEGSAIGVAVLEHLAASGALAVATTHHDALKHYAYASPGAENAAVEFDPDTLAPTFRIRMGTSGPSNAMVVAERMGLPAGVLRRARTLAEEGPVRVDRLMARLGEEEERLRGLERALAAQEEALRAAEAAFEAERTEAEARRRGEAESLLKELRREADALIAELREAEGPEAARRAARERIREMTERAEAGLPEPSIHRNGAPEVPLEVGAHVRLRMLGRVGVVQAVGSGGVLTLSVDGKTLRVPAEAVEPAPAGAAATGRAVVTHETNAESRDFSPELHLRGVRAADAIEVLEKYLDDAALLGVSSVRVVHGKGSGALAKIIAERLEGHPLVASFGPARPEQGGWGVTEIELARR